MSRREMKIHRNYLMHPEGSVMIETGNTKVICNATVQDSVPNFLRDSDEGWVTAEYAMLPRATNTRNRRESAAGKVSGRTAEIQRLIARSLRAVVDRRKMPGMSVVVDCDVIQADGGTRTASICGACVALHDAFNKMIEKGMIEENPMKEFVAAISVGIVNGKPVVDLCYEEDSQADVDFNIVMTESGKFVELQGTAEKNLFSRDELNQMIDAASGSIAEIIEYQKSVVL